MTIDFSDKNIDFDDPIKKVPRASIHKTGKLGFNSDAQKQMDLEDKSFKVGFSEDNKDMFLLEADPNEEMTISPSKAGDYYYLNLKDLFKRRGIPFKEYRLKYDIIEGEYDGRKMWQLKRRENPSERNSKKEKSSASTSD